MANFKAENVKRFIEDISKDVSEKAYEGGGSTGGGWIPVQSGYPLIVHCLAIKQLLIDNGIDIEASAIGDVYINIGATITSGYVPGGVGSMQISTSRNSNINYQASLYGDDIGYETWKVTEDQSVSPTINELLTKSGDVKTYFSFNNNRGYVSFYLNLSIGYISSGHWIEIPSGEISKYFEIGVPEE